MNERIPRLWFTLFAEESEGQRCFVRELSNVDYEEVEDEYKKQLALLRKTIALHFRHNFLLHISF